MSWSSTSSASVSAPPRSTRRPSPRAPGSRTSPRAGTRLPPTRAGQRERPLAVLALHELHPGEAGEQVPPAQARLRGGVARDRREPLLDHVAAGVRPHRRGGPCRLELAVEGRVGPRLGEAAVGRRHGARHVALLVVRLGEREVQPSARLRRPARPRGRHRRAPPVRPGHRRGRRRMRRRRERRCGPPGRWLGQRAAQNRSAASCPPRPAAAAAAPRRTSIGPRLARPGREEEVRRGGGGRGSSSGAEQDGRATVQVAARGRRDVVVHGTPQQRVGETPAVEQPRLLEQRRRRRSLGRFEAGEPPAVSGSASSPRIATARASRSPPRRGGRAST